MKMILFLLTISLTLFTMSCTKSEELAESTPLIKAGNFKHIPGPNPAIICGKLAPGMTGHWRAATVLRMATPITGITTHLINPALRHVITRLVLPLLKILLVPGQDIMKIRL